MYSLSIDVESEWLVPEGPDVDPLHLRGVENLAEGPHEGPIDPHQLLVVDHVSLVEDYPNLVVLASKPFQKVSEFVGNVEFVGIEQKNDSVHPLSEPLQNTMEIIASVQPLLLS